MKRRLINAAIWLNTGNHDMIVAFVVGIPLLALIGLAMFTTA